MNSQINYITEGSGELETDFGKFLIKPGTLMINWPGIWHRYRPRQKTGWVEHYIGFDGELAKQLLTKDMFSPERPLIYCELREDFIDTYYKIFDLILKEKPGISTSLIRDDRKTSGLHCCLPKAKAVFRKKKSNRLFKKRPSGCGKILPPKLICKNWQRNIIWAIRIFEKCLKNTRVFHHTNTTWS